MRAVEVYFLSFILCFRLILAAHKTKIIICIRTFSIVQHDETNRFLLHHSDQHQRLRHEAGRQWQRSPWSREKEERGAQAVADWGPVADTHVHDKSKLERSASLDEMHREEEIKRMRIMEEMRAEACKSRMMRRKTRRSGIADGGLMICIGLAGLASEDEWLFVS